MVGIPEQALWFVKACVIKTKYSPNFSKKKYNPLSSAPPLAHLHSKQQPMDVQGTDAWTRCQHHLAHRERPTHSGKLQEPKTIH